MTARAHPRGSSAAHRGRTSRARARVRTSRPRAPGLLRACRAHALRAWIAALAIVALCFTGVLLAAPEELRPRHAGSTAGVVPAIVGSAFLGGIERSEAPELPVARGRVELSSTSRVASIVEVTFAARSEHRLVRTDARVESVAFFRPRRHVPRMGSGDPPRA